jgi:hypothetical protein
MNNQVGRSEGVMAIPMSMQAPAVVLSVGVEDTRGPSRVVRGRNDPGDPSTSVVLACRDVVDEVRRRMARRGFLWE